MFLANKWDKRSNAFSCDRYGVSTSSPDNVRSLPRSFPTSSTVRSANDLVASRSAYAPDRFSHSWRVTRRPLLCFDLGKENLKIFR